MKKPITICLSSVDIPLGGLERLLDRLDLEFKRFLLLFVLFCLLGCAAAQDICLLPLLDDLT
jgi:hypothetical protein